MALKEKIKNLSKYSIVPCFLAFEVFAILAFSFSGNYLLYGILATVLMLLILLFSLFEIKKEGISKTIFLLFPLVLFSILTAISYYAINHVILGDFHASEIVFVPLGILSVGFTGYLLSLNKDFKIKTFLIVIYSALGLLVAINLLTTLINFGAFHTFIYRDAYMYYGGIRSSVPVSDMAYALEGFKVIEVSVAHYTLYPALLLSCSTLLFYTSIKEEKKTYILYICLTALALLALILVPSIEGLFAGLILIFINLYLFFVKKFPKSRKGLNIALIVILSIIFATLLVMIFNASTQNNFIKDIIKGNSLLDRLFNTNRYVEKFNKNIRDIFSMQYILGFSHYFITEFFAEEIYLSGSYLFDSFMTSGLFGAIALFAFIIMGVVGFNKYFLNKEEQHKEGTLSFVLMFYLYSLLFNDGEYAIFYNLHRPIYMSGPFLLTVFIFVYVASKKIEVKKEEKVEAQAKEEKEEYETI